MFIDNLTLVSLVVFAVALGSFIKVCLMDSCISGRKPDDKDR
jgi:hypothetical protein